ncbi:MAG TPA: preprotein translocase subunit SecG [Verrucomicrobiae bacterium]|jgi:preprotein translocase subunit SecG|nr:preprotein translocase subunit SecG [Verrucomicrobiae bacterium]
MQILYIFLTVLMFLDCVLLVLLVLLQLPKKDAGAGVAFGGAATDALFGAGSGNVLTRITKYVAGIFFGLALIMAVLSSHRPKTGGALLLEDLTKKGAMPISQPTTQSSAPAPVAAPTSGGLLQIPATSSVPAVAPSKSAAPATAPTPNK